MSADAAEDTSRRAPPASWKTSLEDSPSLRTNPKRRTDEEKYAAGVGFRTKGIEVGEVVSDEDEERRTVAVKAGSQWRRVAGEYDLSIVSVFSVTSHTFILSVSKTL